MHDQSVRDQIRDLLWEFDPAGVREFRDEAATEYDALVSGVMHISPTDVSGQLEMIVTLPGNY